MVIDTKYKSPHFYSRSGNVPKYIVLHLADGYYDGTISWECNPNSGISSHFVLGKLGQVAQLVDLSNGAYTQGLNTNQFKDAKIPYIRDNPSISPNRYCVSVECEGFYSEAEGNLPSVQFDTLVKLIRYIQSEVKRIYSVTIPFDREHIIAHSDINPINRPNCNGKAFQWNDLFKALNGDSTSIPSSPDEKLYYKINKTFNNGKWNTEQKGAFDYTKIGLEEAIIFFEDNDLSNEYFIFDPYGAIEYPNNIDNTDDNDNKLIEYENEIKKLESENVSLNKSIEELTKLNNELNIQNNELFKIKNNLSKKIQGYQDEIQEYKDDNIRYKNIIAKVRDAIN